MNSDLKQILGWVMGTIITIMLGLLTYLGNRIIEGQDKMNDTLTTILVQNQDIVRRVTALEADNDSNKTRWKERDEFTRDFFETYDLHKKK